MNNGPRRFRKILIANRGEIACRIIWTCKEMGIRTVAVHSDVDRDSLHVRFADESACIGPAPSSQSYLNIPAIISAAEIFNVDAIHPGYGFLAESAYFAEICDACNIKFIGPRADVIQMMGEKVTARNAMRDAGVPILPGSESAIRSDEEAIKIKNGDVYIERYVERPRHIEIQVMADEHGNCVYLGERECSIQRRHQKLLEESPSPVMTPELRQQMGEAAVAACKAIGYSSAGTFEFLLDDDQRFYFMEMNTRIQVEHPVTEMVTLTDIVRNQIRVAEGEPLGFTQDDVIMVGHAIECRINAESPDTFTPSPGTITTFNLPGGPGVRVERELAIARMRRALDAMVIEGIKTTIPLHLKIMDSPDFQAGNFSTRFMEDFLAKDTVREIPNVTASAALTGVSA